MKVYFVRHGESEANAGDIHQNGTIGLSEKGREQAKFLGNRLSKLPIEFIYSSSMVRAKETTEIINTKINKPTEFTDLLAEGKNPSEIVGLKSTDPESIRIRQIMRENYGKPEWKYSDEENFDEIKQRALQALDFLVNSGKNNILIVTHGGILRQILCIMIFGESLTAVQDRKLLRFFYPSNTGITVCEYCEDKWHLITFNDIAHLAD